MFARGFRLFTKYYIDQSKGDNTQKESNLRLIYGGSQINHGFSSSSSALIAKYNDNIAPRILAVNVKGSFVPSIAAIQITTKLEQIADATFNCAWLSSKENLILLDSSKHFKISQYV